MKFAVIALIANVSAVSLSKPLIHPQTGLAITTTGQHWYGQPPLAMAEEEPAAPDATAAPVTPAATAAPAATDAPVATAAPDAPAAPAKAAAPAEKADETASTDEDLNIYSSSFRGPGHLFPLKPKAPRFTVKFPVKYDTTGYTLPEKVAILVPEVHMEVNNLDATYKYPRTAFYLQTDADISTNQDKLEKMNRFDNQKGKDVGPDMMGGYVHDFVKANVSVLPLPCRAINAEGDLPADCHAGYEGL